MFFSTELLSRRDSGYGLLWLAATLGSKSKKLPRRSVLTADINQLCDLVSEPPEPLALRLSSNLMIGVVRVYKFKHEIFEFDVSNCVTSLKKTLQELHAMNNTTNLSLEMAQPNGLREDALNLTADPGMAMANEFDGLLDMDWEFMFRNATHEKVLGDDEDFDPDSFHEPVSSEPRLQHSKKKLHQLDESHDHLFSASFLNSLSGDLGADNEVPSSANDMLFDLDFGGDADVGLGEEMERDLEEAWNVKIVRGDEATRVPSGGVNFDDAPMDIDQGFEADFGGGEMDFADQFGPGIEQEHIINKGSAMQEEEQHTGIIGPNWPGPGSATGPFHTPPPRNITPVRSILSRRNVDEHQDGNAPQDTSQLEQQNKKPIVGPGEPKKIRKKVTLVDPRTELTDDELKFQRDNYLQIMKKLRCEAQKKKEQRDGKRRFEEELWAPPKEWRAPELIEWYNQRVVYPVKAREAAWRKELEELQRPTKKPRLLEKDPSERFDEEYIPTNIPAHGSPRAGDFDFGMDMDVANVGGFGDDWGGGMDAFIDPLPAQQDLASGGSHPSSDDPGQPRRASSRPPSLPGSGLLGHGSLNLSQGDRLSNNIFPWHNTGSSSSNAGPPRSFGMGGGSGSDLDFPGLSFDSTTVRFRRGSKAGSDSLMAPPGSPRGEGEGIDIESHEPMEFEASLVDQNQGETQESEGTITLERNSFNFLGYAKMHFPSDSKPFKLFFSDIVPAESSSTRVAAEGFYHCLALATKDLIRLEQTAPYGPIRIQIK